MSSMPSEHGRHAGGGAPPWRMGRLTLVVLTVLAGLGGRPLSADVYSSVISCPFFGVGSTDVFHGFYVPNYPAINLSKVTLGYSTNTPGLFTISLTARRNSYDGPLLGTTQTATVHVGSGAETLVTFDFGGAPVTPGDTITFSQVAGQLASDNNEFGNLYYDEGLGTCSGVIETQGTAAPLDTALHAGVAVSIDTLNTQTFGPSCTPSDTVLCVDDVPGDRRFQVRATFATVQGGGLSGKAQAVPLSQLGVVHGGLFWFFGGDNPEMLFKIVNGCQINDHFWAFLSAATNVGFTVTVDDTYLTNSKTYTNVDLTEAPPIQDVSALASCHGCTSNAQCRTGFLCCPLPIGGNRCLPPAANGQCPLLP
jgi:hypothetical protein